MPRQRIEEGECVASIACERGFAWQTIWSHSENTDLRIRRHDPNVLNPGDELFVPELHVGQEPEATGESHRFRLHGHTALLRLVLCDERNRAWGDRRYELRVGDHTLSGTTDGGGRLEHEVPADARAGELTVWLPPRGPDPERAVRRMDSGVETREDGGGDAGDASEPEEMAFVWQLAIGYLDPVAELSGVQARLCNLGYYGGEIDGVEGPLTRAALQRFQEACELTADGSASSETRERLQEEHGC